MKSQSCTPARMGSVSNVAQNSQPPIPDCVQKILVAEDNEFVRQLISSTLAEAYFEVQVAADGEQAWEALQLGDYDLLVTDNEMPRLTGLQLVQRIRGAGNGSGDS